MRYTHSQTLAAHSLIENNTRAHTHRMPRLRTHEIDTWNFWVIIIGVVAILADNIYR